MPGMSVGDNDREIPALDGTLCPALNLGDEHTDCCYKSRRIACSEMLRVHEPIGDLLGMVDSELESN
jgi:hypothetical protein